MSLSALLQKIDSKAPAGQMDYSDDDDAENNDDDDDNIQFEAPIFFKKQQPAGVPERFGGGAQAAPAVRKHRGGRKPKNHYIMNEMQMPQFSNAMVSPEMILANIEVPKFPPMPKIEDIPQNLNGEFL
jgi:hypothetical protein